MKYYWAIKRNKVLIHTTLMNLENGIERSQSQRTTDCIDAIYEMSRIGSSTDRKEISGCPVLRLCVGGELWLRGVGFGR